jgi:hypothetical protein
MTAKTTDHQIGQLVLPGRRGRLPGPVDAIGMYFSHHAFRRDLTAFTAAVAGTPVEDRATWKALAERWERFYEILHKHHVGEDAGLWPLLLARADAAGDVEARATLDAMEAEHGEVGPLLASCAVGFDRLASLPDADARDALEVRIVALNERLRQHLAHEERDAMALVQRYLTHAEWDRVEEEHFRAAYGPRQLPFLVSWTLHRLPEEHFARVRDAMGGRPMEVIWRLFWRLSFERRERVAFRYV